MWRIAVLIVQVCKVVLLQELRPATATIVQELRGRLIPRAATRLPILREHTIQRGVIIKQILSTALIRAAIIRQEAIATQEVPLLLRGRVLHGPGHLVRIVQIVATVPNRGAKRINIYTYLFCMSNYMKFKTGQFL